MNASFSIFFQVGFVMEIILIKFHWISIELIANSRFMRWLNKASIHTSLQVSHNNSCLNTLPTADYQQEIFSLFLMLDDSIVACGG